MTNELHWQHTLRPVPLDFGGPTHIPFEPVDPSVAGIARFEATAARFAGKIAIDDGTLRLTYDEVLQAVHGLASQLAGLPPGRPIVGLLHNTASFPIVFLAHLQVGIPLIPVDAGDPVDRKLAILREASPSAILLGEGVSAPEGLFASDLPQLRFAIHPGEAIRPPFGTPGLDDLAGIAYTSGSTGRPKGLAFSQRTFLATMADYIAACHINADDRILSLASLSGAGCRDALVALSVGATLRIVDIKCGGVSAVMRALHAERITILAFVPSVLRVLMCLDGAREAFRHLRILDLFGDRTTPADIAIFRDILPPECHIRLSLSSTEATDMFHWFVRREALEDDGALPCGYLAHGKSVALLDENGKPAAAGQDGELVVRGRAVALGIWQGGRLLPGPFVTVPGDPIARIYHTGDVIRLRPDGLAEFVGRRDRQIKIRGLRANLADVEDALRMQPGVADAAVVPRMRDEETALVAYAVAADPSATPDSAAIRAALADDLPAHMIPEALRFLPSIPRLANFKPDYVALTAFDRSAEPAPAAPSTEPIADGRAALAVRHAWDLVFDRRPFDPDLALEDAGGDSLKVLKLLFEIERYLDHVVPLDIFRAGMTARDLAVSLGRVLHAPSPDRSHDDRPVICVVASTDFDIGRLGGLRKTLAGWFNFSIVQPCETVVPEALVHDIVARSGSGLINLVHAGAAAIAPGIHEQLRRRQRDLGLVLLIDTEGNSADHLAPFALTVAADQLFPPHLDDLSVRIIKAYSDSQAR
jgi:acyl-coenzyme A synthetase/AMP-(fatty) acid ligase